jgi:hypothetical protein
MALQATNSDEAPDVGQAFLPPAFQPALVRCRKQSTPGGGPAAGRNACPTCVFNGADTLLFAVPDQW